MGSTARGAKGRDKDLLIELKDMDLYDQKYLDYMMKQHGNRAYEEIFYNAIMDPDSPNAMSLGKLKGNYDLIFKVKNKEDGETHYFNTHLKQLQIGADSGKIFSHMLPSDKIVQSIEKGAKIDLLTKAEAPVKYTTVKTIRKGGLEADIVPAKTTYDKDGKATILINAKELRKKYDEKAWTKPKVKGVNPLPKDTFKSYEEWEAFVIGHEQGHAAEGPSKIKRGTPEYAEMENRMNDLGLKALERFRADKKGVELPSDEKVLINLDHITHNGTDYKLSNFEYSAARKEYANIVRLMPEMKVSGLLNELMYNMKVVKQNILKATTKDMNKKVSIY